MSHVTSAGCCLTPDDTTDAQPTAIINDEMERKREEGRDGQGQNANSLINRSNTSEPGRESDS